MDQYHDTTFTAETAEHAEDLFPNVFSASSARSAVIVVIGRY